jgi:hypothetical protein
MFTAADEKIIGELQALFARHNAGTAPSAKAVFKPTKKIPYGPSLKYSTPYVIHSIHWTK